MGHKTVLDARVAGTLAEMPRHPRVAPLTLRSILDKGHSRPGAVQVDASVQDAVRLMGEHDTCAVLVMDGARVVGVFSCRDYVRLGAASVPGAALREVMAPCNISATVENSALDALSLIREHRLQHLPVREGENVIALMSREDIQEEIISYLEQVFREYGLDQQIVFLPGTYSC